LNLLVIDTSTRFASVGAMNDAGDRATRSWHSSQNHGRELMPAVAETLEELSFSAPELSHVAVALGPGGFSAVRVGISAAIGLVVPRQLPVLGIPTHLIEVEPHTSLIASDTPVYTLIPAGRNEISWTRHIPDQEFAEMTRGVHSADELATQIEPSALLCGEACDLMAGVVDRSRIRGHAAPTRDPNSLIDIAVNAFGSGQSTPYEELRPIYARPPSISKPNPAK
jgi:tRNA threonylcarbamoyl adenosine modification protein YeaZ